MSRRMAARLPLVVLCVLIGSCATPPGPRGAYSYVTVAPDASIGFDDSIAADPAVVVAPVAVIGRSTTSVAVPAVVDAAVEASA